jgi:outer membrane protein OmpA-like peptidoglycan-associated protein
MINKLTYTFVLILIFSCSSNGQYMLGYSNSNYAGLQGGYLNPAHLADSRHFLYFNLFAQSFNFTNDYISYTGDQSLIKYLKNGGSGTFEENFTKNLNGNDHFLDAQYELRGPGGMISWNEKNSLALTSRVRFAFQAFDVAEPLITTISDGYEPTTPSLYQGLPEDHFKINALNYSEFALSYARIVYDNKQHFLKAGLSVKRLRGLFVFNMENRLLDFKFASGDSIVGYNADASIIYAQESQFGVDSFGFNPSTFSPKKYIKDYFFGDNKIGGGFGFDLGLVYEWRPSRKYYYTMDCGPKLRNPERSKYKLRFSASVNDMGRIIFKNDNMRKVDIQFGNTVNLNNIDTVKWGQTDTLKHYDSTDDLIAIMNNITGGGLTTTQPFRYKSKLPTTLIVSADYLAAKNVYINLTYMQSLRKKNSFDGLRMSTTIALTPRYERRWLEASLPIIIRPGLKTIDYGLGIRLGYLYMGIDNFGGLIGLGNVRGLNFYMGLSIGIHKYMRKDKDGDKVSKDMDKCPDEAGTCETMGCPDKDLDGIVDKDDKCPDVPGVKKFKGCPDTDEDDVMDSLDHCPTVPGVKALNGCPDTDKDGITDSLDKCPEKAGPKEMFGCPDTDKDGLGDGDDRCPEKAGPKLTLGCPDKDKDGIVDKDDKCPEKAGSVEFLGCPDRDKDSIPDYLDKCPTKFGLASNNGCPDKMQERREEMIIENSMFNLEFESASAIIINSSYNNLDSLAQLLLINKKYRMLIAGYTDNVGNKEDNKQLSQDRANAVRNYLISKGVEEERINAFGYGEEFPIDNNENEEGKQNNRRVEFELIK